MSRVKSALWGSISSQVSMIIFMLLSIVITPLILKFLDKEAYGFYIVLIQFIGYLSMLELGLGGAISRSLAANRGEDEASKTAVNKIVSTSFFTYSVLGTIVIVGGICFAPFVPGFFKMKDSLHTVAASVTVTLCVFIGIQFPIRVLNGIFYAHQRQLLSNVVGFTMSLVNTLLPILFLYLGYGLWSFAFTNMVCITTEIFLSFFLIRKYYPFIKIRIGFFEKKILKDLFNFGFFLFLNSIAVQIIFFTDRFFIGSFISLSAATLFSLTAKAPELSRELIFRITDNAYPAMVEISSKENKQKLKGIIQKLLLITVCLSNIAFWMILILNPWFLKLWVGDNYYAGQVVLILTLLTMFQHTLLHVGALCLHGAGIVKGLGFMALIEAGLNLGFTFTLGKIYGMPGILAANVVATWLIAMWYVPYLLKKHLGVSYRAYVKPIVLPILLVSSFGFVVYSITNNLFEVIQLSWLNFVMATFAIGVLFALFAWIFLLRKEFSSYIPVRLKKYLLASGSTP